MSYFFFILYVLYYAEKSFYPLGTSISQAIFIITLGLSTILFFKTIKFRNKELFYYAWTSLLVINVIGYIFTTDYNNTIYLGMFRNILFALTGFYPYYYFSRKKILKPEYFKYLLILLLPLVIVKFYLFENNVLGLEYTDDTVNNTAYSFVVLIPYLYSVRNRILELIILLIVSFFIIQSAKRGALIAGFLGMLPYLYLLFKSISYKDKFNRLISLSFISISFIVIGYLIYQHILSNEFLLERLGQMLEGDSSQRNEIYSSIFNAWMNSDKIINLLFGFGFGSSFVITGGYFAHNDWLELLSNFGLIGFLIYLLIFVGSISLTSIKNLSLEHRLQLLSVIIIWFSMTLFSMWYTSLETFTQAILLGFIFGNIDKKSSRLIKII